MGCWVHAAEKVGQDAGEICGIGPIGVAATNDVEALLEASPEARAAADALRETASALQAALTAEAAATGGLGDARRADVLKAPAPSGPRFGRSPWWLAAAGVVWRLWPREDPPGKLPGIPGEGGAECCPGR